MTELQDYVTSNLSRELKEVGRRKIVDEGNILSAEEQTIIYKYTEDGFEGLNASLRASNGLNRFEVW